ncbi:F-box domain-containing protein [Colletotrichum plurivorum]|uniref:F-box domain-containing protein n=1 Tax=Colletotrichum plurivorum TaxID=2175906 RepID=A0A8H6K009_9PEZI|nr:F-box domain-containing protein [Colletotrichum plurivorum]
MAETESTSSDEAAAAEKRDDEIVRVCSYHRRDLDLVVVRSLPHEMEPVLASIATAAAARPQAHLGPLSLLPPELVSMVILHLDVRSAFRLRQVNSLTRSFVTDTREYRLLAKHGLEGLRGLLRGGIAQFHLLRDLYRVLLQKSCAECGSFGHLLFLPTLERCCHSCLGKAERYHVLARTTFASAAKVSRNSVERLGLSLRTVPGVYSWYGAVKMQPKYLVCDFAAWPVLLARGMITDDSPQKVPVQGWTGPYRLMAATTFPSYSLSSGRVDRGLTCRGCPVLENTGYSIRFCKERCYSREGFLAHFKECSRALRLWADSREGTRDVDESELVRMVTRGDGRMGLH